MNRWELVDSESVPDGGGFMALPRRHSEFAIRVDGRQLMNNREHGSEDALAELACDRLGKCPEARVLIGGPGMGFTLAASLRCFDRTSRRAP